MDPKLVKKEFPIFGHHPDLVYLDSGATSQKPQVVIERLREYYEKENANIHRGIYDLSESATSLFEDVREKIARFINASDPHEVIFTRGTTEAINMVARGLALQKEDEVVITEMEHHANLVPWQEAKCSVKYIPFTKEGTLDLTVLPRLITKKIKIVAFIAVSNVLGTINPNKIIVQKIKSINPNCLVLIDAAQAVPHMPIDVEDLGCDFLAFSGHKMCGPTGVGVLWGKRELLERLEPYQYGGSMISRVTKEKSTWAQVPHKFEAGTPHIAGVIGLGAAVDFLEGIGMKNVEKHSRELTHYAYSTLSKIDGVTVYGPEVERIGCVSFMVKDVHAHDVAQVLNEEQIAVRAGHHCAMVLHTVLGIPSSVRASFYVYNTKKDVERLVRGIKKVMRVFAP